MHIEEVCLCVRLVVVVVGGGGGGGGGGGALDRSLPQAKYQPIPTCIYPPHPRFCC